MPQLETNTELKNKDMNILLNDSDAIKNAFASVGVAFFALVIYLYIFDINIGGN